MTFPSRRKPLAQIICFGFAGFLASTTAIEALAQSSVPLRVDPVLLGLPPIKPEEAPAPARPAPPRPVLDEKSRPEVKPVEAAVVESRPVGAAPVAPPLAVKTSPVAPVAAPVTRDMPVSPPASAPGQQPVPAAGSVTQKPVPVPAPAPRPAAPSYPVPAAASPSSALVPLRVDPALLGLPPASASAASAPFTSSTGGAARTLASSQPVAKGSSAAQPVDDGKSWYQRLWAPVANAYDKGSLEFYLPLVTYHLRSYYTEDKIATYQERPMGFGVGRGLYNEKGNWEGVYGMAFQDSHFKPMYMAGYGWKSIWRPSEDTRLGLGYVAGLMARTDIMHYVPFPLVLPMASMSYKKFSLEGTYVPGGKGFGNIFFIWAKWELGKEGEAIGTPSKPEPVQETVLVNTHFGPSVPLASQRVPYGPALDVAETAGVSGAGSSGLAGGLA